MKYSCICVQEILLSDLDTVKARYAELGWHPLYDRHIPPYSYLYCGWVLEEAPIYPELSDLEHSFRRTLSESEKAALSHQAPHL